ncbi:hypothetical protein HanIR_Chr06g0262661 [Helianthus annuus]|nr:hypothetical protein HanIR_Chr06g0262661 [Helianthus annuus]
MCLFSYIFKFKLAGYLALCGGIDSVQFVMISTLTLTTKGVNKKSITNSF